MTTASPARLSGLDGLRGLAALVVVIYHGTKVAAPALGGPLESVYRALADSPAKLAFAGTEAVLVFFALSGLVVALPAFRSGFSWRGYFPARLVRLYLPVWAALLLAAAFILLIPRDPSVATAGSWLRNANATSVELPQLLAEASLWPASYDLVNVLWSLRWEVVFSVALPLFVAAAVLLRRYAVVTVGALVMLSIAGRVADLDALVYLPVFLAGTLVAARLAEFRAWGERRSTGFWIAAAALSCGLLISGWLLRPIVEPGSTGGRVLWGLAAAGAVGLVVTVTGSPAIDRLLSRRLPAWLGRVSFGLYLVHVPVLATLAYVWGEDAWPAVLAVGIPASLLLAAVFTRLVERPSHRLARALRRRLGRAAAPQPAVPATTSR